MHDFDLFVAHKLREPTGAASIERIAQGQSENSGFANFEVGWQRRLRTQSYKHLVTASRKTVYQVDEMAFTTAKRLR
jgi:hypothetical protein